MADSSPQLSAGHEPDPLHAIADRLSRLVLGQPEWWCEAVRRWANEPPLHGKGQQSLPIPLPADVKLTELEGLALLAAIFQSQATGNARLDPWPDADWQVSSKAEYDAAMRWAILSSHVAKAPPEHWEAHRFSVNQLVAEAERALAGVKADTASKGQGDEAGDDPPAATVHSPDFRSVSWFGRNYSFTPNQAACLQVLWDAWQSGAPDVGGETLLQASDASTQRIDVVFRDNAAWGAMIVQGGTKGTYRLTQTIADSPKRPKRATKKTSARARK